MPLFSTTDRAFVRALSGLTYSNPFLPEFVEYEREALGAGFKGTSHVWGWEAGSPDRRTNTTALVARAEPLLARTRTALADGAKATPEELELYEDLVLFVLYYSVEEGFVSMIRDSGPATGRVGRKAAFYVPFRERFERSGVKTRHYTPELHAASFVLPRWMDEITGGLA